MDNLGKDGGESPLLCRVSGKQLLGMSRFVQPPQTKLVLMGQGGPAAQRTTGEAGNDTSEGMRRFVVLGLPEALVVRLDERAGECNVSRDDYVAKSVELALWFSANEQQAIASKVGELVSLVWCSCVPKIREVFRLVMAELEAGSLEKAAEDFDVGQQE